MAPIPMALGPYMFHATNFGYNKFGRSVSTNWAEIEVVGGPNDAQWTGGQDEKLTIGGVLFPEEYGGMRTMRALQSSAQTGIILPLLTLAGDVFGNFRIESVDEDQSYHTRYGLPRRNEFSIALKKHVGRLANMPSIVETLFG